MISWFRRFVARLNGTAALPRDFRGSLDMDEQVLAVAGSDGGPLVATSLGLWLPESESARRVGWHLLSKASWDEGTLTLIEAEESGTAGEAVLLRDRPARRFTLSSRGRVPEVVHARITGSIRSSHHRELPGGGAWFVQRKVPGQDGIVLQVRADRGTDETALRDFAFEVAEQLHHVRESGHQ
ncbi:hypothetical protein DFQ14_110103 [Halopolyspora algeriensis]|uniref:Uncharacterized protein n=1 Tax=Halopolyspora algeriensis TaxID=1500506 RepID=A0A368VHW8_9ACTN|nr:hypothetical protein [Halopolyspora algeriensis]RCW40774.1 hypothetical protein DFQ14_110103 [Halopolyspora algeriensis]TQM53307.1 hypothetical protein FHU43_2695 [Halopolyspora algeriensis]